jgi:hypothetical protein
MTAGDVKRTSASPPYIIKGVTKTNTAITKGVIHHFDTDGWAPCGADGYGKHGVAMNTQAATAATQKEAQIMVEGTVMVSKAAGALKQGQPVKSNVDGKAVIAAFPADGYATIVGFVVEDAANADTEVMIALV